MLGGDRLHHAGTADKGAILLCKCLQAFIFRCEIADKPYPIFKNPKDGGFKKSQKGCCVVVKDATGSYTYQDGFTWEEACKDAGNQLVPVFKDGKLLVEQGLQEIRARLHGGRF